MIEKLVHALRHALIEEMTDDKNVVIIGEDVGAYGGAFKVTDGLMEMFGTERVCDTPISEIAIVGAALGAAVTGLRPVVEIQFDDFLTCAMDQICNQTAKMHFMSGGQLRVPLVIRTPIGATGRGAQHSQSFEAWFMHTPGLKIVMPSTPYDAKGLLKSAIIDDNPVLFFEHKRLYGANFKKEKLNVFKAAEEEPYYIPLGIADIKRKGKDVTIIATSLMVHESIRASEELMKHNIDAEVIDPRTLVPLDKETILTSVKKTGRVIIVTEDVITCGVSAELSAVIADEGFSYLKAPIKRVSVPHTPIPFAPNNERAVIPNKEKIVEAVKSLIL
jgi:acetoin:2,6-dichlorophenolindophenol oxidoreductase subunit beta